MLPAAASPPRAVRRSCRRSLFATGSARVRKKASTLASDTNGFVRRYDPVIDELLEVTDPVMLDLKQMNDEIHQNRSASLTIVRWNSPSIWRRRISMSGSATWWSPAGQTMMIPRTARANLPAIWAMSKIELLPYHELGKHKWVAMGEEYKLDGVHPPKKETMERVKASLSSMVTK